MARWMSEDLAKEIDERENENADKQGAYDRPHQGLRLVAKGVRQACASMCAFVSFAFARRASIFVPPSGHVTLARRQ